MKVSKLVVIPVWLLLAACFFLPPDSTLSFLGRAAFFVMAAVHVVEFFVFLPFLRSAKGSLPLHFVNMLIFGLFHYQELRAAGDSAAS